jgi:hypothetical protein
LHVNIFKTDTNPAEKILQA